MRTLHIPAINVISDNGREGSFVIEPLYRGFGVTLGNSLRRVMLSSLQGGAVTAFKIPNVSHEFSVIPGVKEDMVQVTLNLKRLRFRVFNDQPQIVQVEKKGKGKVTGADIKGTADLEMVNPTQHIATLDSPKASLNMELKVENGRGYVPVEERSDEDAEVGMIAIDSVFSPVERVRYKITHTRVGQVTGLDKLSIDINTDGSLSPTDALHQAAAILMEQLAALAGEQRSSLLSAADEAAGGDEPDELNFSVEDLNLSPRTTNALINNQVMAVRDLIQLNDTDLRNLKGFGSKAFNEVLSKLKELELR